MYKAPVMKFEEITFFERIASDACWSNNSFYFDNPFTKQVEQHNITINSRKNKCGDRESLSAVNQALGYLSSRHDLKYLVYSVFAYDKQNTKMWGFSIVPS
ncbi:MAG: hypothetical protein GX757_03050 [Clostridiales bacterium]|nr:hypothetical protein [Clostridiales bacterium]